MLLNQAPTGQVRQATAARGLAAVLCCWPEQDIASLAAPRGALKTRQEENPGSRLQLQLVMCPLVGTPAAVLAAGRFGVQVLVCRCCMGRGDAVCATRLPVGWQLRVGETEFM